MLKRFLGCRAGAVSVEYSLLIALVAMTATAGLVALGAAESSGIQSVTDLF
jgi:Flp pilus assembly pilin Flp